MFMATSELIQGCCEFAYSFAGKVAAQNKYISMHSWLSGRHEVTAPRLLADRIMDAALSRDRAPQHQASDSVAA